MTDAEVELERQKREFEEVVRTLLGLDDDPTLDSFGPVESE